MFKVVRYSRCNTALPRLLRRPEEILSVICAVDWLASSSGETWKEIGWVQQAKVKISELIQLGAAKERKITNICAGFAYRTW